MSSPVISEAVKKDRRTAFCIPCNWDPQLVESLGTFPVIHYLYGKLSNDEIGGGRPFFKLPHPNKTFVKNYLKKARQKNLHFNYLLNSSCIGNKEYRKGGRKKILNLLKWAVDIGVDYVTVALPYLAEIIKTNFPKMNICVSKMAFVCDGRQAKFWEDLGAREITLNPDVNRNFKKLEQIRKSVRCDLILLVNEACLYHCPYVYYHANSDSHASQTGSTQNYICYSRIFCEKIFITDTSQIIRSTFIRPEDLHFYEKIGINKFKLVGRTRPTDWILTALRAYVDRRQEGNLADILGTFSLHREDNAGAKSMNALLKNMKSLQEVERLRKSSLCRPPIYIDNKKLDNFLLFFKNFDCENRLCQDCTYCHRYAKRSIFINQKEKATALRNLNKLIQWVKKR